MLKPEVIDDDVESEEEIVETQRNYDIDFFIDMIRSYFVNASKLCTLPGFIYFYKCIVFIYYSMGKVVFSIQYNLLLYR